MPESLEPTLWNCEPCDWFYQGARLLGGPDDDGVRYCVYCGKPMKLIDEGEADDDST